MTHEASHRVMPLLEPCSIAVVGASGREGRPGYHTVRAVRALGLGGAVYPVTPSYEHIDGLECYARSPIYPNRSIWSLSPAPAPG